MSEFSDPLAIPDPYETGTCPTCGSPDVLIMCGGRCSDKFHDAAIIEAMERSLRLHSAVSGLAVYTKDDHS